MESIRILQNTYEDLYVLAKPIREFLQEQLPKAFKNWREIIDEIMENQVYNYNYIILEELDIYYLYNHPS